MPSYSHQRVGDLSWCWKNPCHGQPRGLKGANGNMNNGAFHSAESWFMPTWSWRCWVLVTIALFIVLKIELKLMGVEKIEECCSCCVSHIRRECQLAVISHHVGCHMPEGKMSLLKPLQAPIVLWELSCCMLQVKYSETCKRVLLLLGLPPVVVAVFRWQWMWHRMGTVMWNFKPQLMMHAVH